MGVSETPLPKKLLGIPGDRNRERGFQLKCAVPIDFLITRFVFYGFSPVGLLRASFQGCSVWD